MTKQMTKTETEKFIKELVEKYDDIDDVLNIIFGDVEDNTENTQQ